MAQAEPRAAGVGGWGWSYRPEASKGMTRQEGRVRGVHWAITYRASQETHNVFQDPRRQPAGPRNKECSQGQRHLILSQAPGGRRKHRPYGRVQLWRGLNTNGGTKAKKKRRAGPRGPAGWAHASRLGWQALWVVPEGQTGPPPLPSPGLQAASPAWKVPTSTPPTIHPVLPSPPVPRRPDLPPLRPATPPRWQWHRTEG